MTEKRFVDYFDKDHNYIIQDLVNEDEYQVGFVNCDEDKFLELVNALAETSCDCITDCEIVMKKLKKENEQLKLLSDAVREELGLANRDNTALEKENGQLEEDLDYYKAKCASLEVRMFNLEREYDKLKSENIDLRKDLGEFEKSINIQGLIGENEQLKHQNELLSDELEQCKAVINNRWSEYLKKKGVEE